MNYTAQQQYGRSEDVNGGVERAGTKQSCSMPAREAGDQSAAEDCKTRPSNVTRRHTPSNDTLHRGCENCRCKWQQCGGATVAQRTLDQCSRFPAAHRIKCALQRPKGWAPPPPSAFFLLFLEWRQRQRGRAEAREAQSWGSCSSLRVQCGRVRMLPAPPHLDNSTSTHPTDTRSGFVFSEPTGRSISTLLQRA